MILFLVFLYLFQFVLCEPMLYMFPSHPELHPKKMYPNQQFSRGRVRDLPDDGVIYLNRIKPIGEEHKKHKPLPKVEEEISQKIKDDSSFERYSSSEERRTQAAISTSSIPIKFAEKTETFQPPKVAIVKHSNSFESSATIKETSLSTNEEVELDRLLDELIKSEGKSKSISGLPKIGRSKPFKNTGTEPKVIQFDGTARVKKVSDRSASDIQIRRTASFTDSKPQRNQQGRDYDPWERLGQ